MTAILEREVKLRFETADAARAAVLRTGAQPIRCRRLQEDCLLDTIDEALHHQRCVLRVRLESGKSLVTFKGPVQPSLMKLRDELETVVATVRSCSGFSKRSTSMSGSATRSTARSTRSAT